MKTNDATQEDVRVITYLIPRAKELLRYHTEAHAESLMYAERNQETGIRHISKAIGQAKIQEATK